MFLSGMFLSGAVAQAMFLSGMFLSGAPAAAMFLSGMFLSGRTLAEVDVLERDVLERARSRTRCS